MERKTIIYAVVDKTNKKFVVRNRNTDDFCKRFRELYSLAVPNNEAIDSYATAFRLNDMCDDERWRFFAVMDAENNYNRDQKIINERKKFYSDQYLMEGFEEDPTLDNDGSTIKYNSNVITAMYNVRDLVTLYEEKLEKLKKQYDEKEKEIERKATEYIINKRKELKTKINEIYDELSVEICDLKKERDELRNNIDDLLKLKDKESMLNQNILTLNKEVYRLETERTKQENNVKSLCDRTTSLNNQLDELNDIYHSTRRKYIEAKNDLEKLNEKVKKVDTKGKFYIKDYNDLLMWQSFAADYGYDKTGIQQLINDLNKYKEITNNERN